MKKLLAIVGISISVASVQACLINLENDTNTPVTINNQGKTSTIAPHGAITLGKADQKADFVLMKNNMSYHMQQIACSKNHLINLKTSEIGKKKSPYFRVNKTRIMPNKQSINSCGCGHK